MIHKTFKAARILFTRLRSQGIKVTLLWVLGRVIPGITGIPNLTYCQVSPQLLVGTQFSRSGSKLLEQAGISAVVNMRQEFDDRQNNLWVKKYCHLPTIDDTAPSIDQLYTGVKFIEDEIRAGGKVYIHCGAGIGRAPTMAAAYFINQGYSLEEAEIEIKKNRPFINIMPDQYKQLQEFEKLEMKRRKK